MVSRKESVGVNSSEILNSNEEIEAIVEGATKNINRVAEEIKSRFSDSGSEELNGMVDDALVYVAEETIANAGEDGQRTDEEEANVSEAVTDVVVRGVMEQSDGVSAASMDNAAAKFARNKRNIPDLAKAINKLQEIDAKSDFAKSLADLINGLLDENSGKNTSDAGLSETKTTLPLGAHEVVHESPVWQPKYYNMSDWGAMTKKAKLPVPQPGDVATEVSPTPTSTTPDAIATTVTTTDGIAMTTEASSTSDSEITVTTTETQEATNEPTVWTPKKLSFLDWNAAVNKSAPLTAQLLSTKTEGVTTSTTQEGMPATTSPREISATYERRRRPRSPEDMERRRRQSLRAVEVARGVSEDLEHHHDGEPMPLRELRCDGSHIEGQRIGVTVEKGPNEDGIEETRTVLSLKLVGAEGGSDPVIDDPSYDRHDGAFAIGDQFMRGDMPFVKCSATILTKNGVRFVIAGSKPRNMSNGETVRAAIGMIKIEIPSDCDRVLASETVADFLEDGLGIDDAFGEVPQDAERKMKQSRYGWMHLRGRYQRRAEGDATNNNHESDLSSEDMEAAEKLVLREVFPGYSTYVEEGKHEEYLGDDEEHVRAMHKLSSSSKESVFRVLTQGLMGTSTRFSRGIFRCGMSSIEDLHTGGADSVFTRILSRKSGTDYGTVVVLKPELFDRTDWYSYASDKFGSTSEDTFVKRCTPEEMIDAAKQGMADGSNEAMFRAGISPEYVESILAPDDSHRHIFLRYLRGLGVRQVGGRTVDEIIITHSDYKLSDEDLLAKRGDEFARARMREAGRERRQAAVLAGEESCTDLDEMIDLADYDNETEARLFDQMVASEGVDRARAIVVDYFLNNPVQPVGSVIRDGIMQDNPDCDFLGYCIEQISQNSHDSAGDISNQGKALEGVMTDYFLSQIAEGKMDYSEFTELVIDKFGDQQEAIDFFEAMANKGDEVRKSILAALKKPYVDDLSKSAAFARDSYSSAVGNYMLLELGLTSSDLYYEAKQRKDEIDASVMDDVKHKILEEDATLEDVKQELESIGEGDHEDFIRACGEVAQFSDEAKAKVKEYFVTALKQRGINAVQDAMSMIESGNADDEMRLMTEVLGVDYAEVSRDIVSNMLDRYLTAIDNQVREGEENPVMAADIDHVMEKHWKGVDNYAMMSEAIAQHPESLPFIRDHFNEILFSDIEELRAMAASIANGAPSSEAHFYHDVLGIDLEDAIKQWEAEKERIMDSVIARVGDGEDLDTVLVTSFLDRRISDEEAYDFYIALGAKSDSLKKMMVSTLVEEMTDYSSDTLREMIADEEDEYWTMQKKLCRGLGVDLNEILAVVLQKEADAEAKRKANGESTGTFHEVAHTPPTEDDSWTAWPDVSTDWQSSGEMPLEQETYSGSSDTTTQTAESEIWPDWPNMTFGTAATETTDGDSLPEFPDASTISPIPTLEQLITEAGQETDSESTTTGSEATTTGSEATTTTQTSEDDLWSDLQNGWGHGNVPPDDYFI